MATIPMIEDMDSAQRMQFEELDLARKRYLAATYVSAGVPVNSEHARLLAAQKHLARGDTWTQSNILGCEVAPAPARKQIAQTAHEEIVDVGRELWMQISNPESGDLHDVRVLQDSGSKFNWINPSVLRSCGLLPIRTKIPIEGTGFDGTSWLSTSHVEITWIGAIGKAKRTTFHVALPKSPFELIVGSDFLNEYGWKGFFRDKPTQRVLIIAQAKVTDKEKEEMAKLEAEAKAHSAEIERRRKAKKAREQENRAARRAEGSAPYPRPSG